MPSPGSADTLAADSAARADSLAMVARLAETRPRYAVRPVPPTDAFEAAVHAGTRTEDGRPGPRYWQQFVQYRIEVEIDPSAARVQGAETVVYHNNSPDTLDFLMFNLYQNVFAEGAQRVRRVPVTGGMRLEYVAVDGGTSHYQIDGTLMRLELPRPLPPQGRAIIDFVWHFTVPPAGAPRTGHDRQSVFTVAQWYPQVATYDDLRGWHDRPYWSNAEFYLEYGDFDVAITAPEGWLVAATGTLENADEVLAETARERLAAVRSTDDVVAIVTTDDHSAGTATAREPGGLLTWRFRARNVRDFAFATANRYVWDATRAVLPAAGGDSPPDTVIVNALYRPQATAWREAAQYTRHALAFNARRWHPYVYPQITAAEGPVGGMEYPMLIFVGAPTEPRRLYEVIAHEVAHQWWGMMVGSNETDYAWQDEGLTSWTENHAVTEFLPDADAFAATADAYLDIAGSDAERPIMREADLYGPGGQYVIATYRKPAALLRALAAVIGEQTLDVALRVYADRWLLRHPTPFDLFNTIEDVAGRDLDWFWHPWFYETAVLDQAIAAVDVRPTPAGRERVMILVADQGDAPMPAPIMVTTMTGATHELELPVEPWLEGRANQLAIIELTEPVQRIEIDPARAFPDVDRSNNVWERTAR
ncbi:MAG: M1 family metallopeptidase [Longimicrobiales bacterium]